MATSLLWGQAACDPAREESSAQQRLEVQVVGCALIDGEGSCTLDAQRTLRVWIPKPWAQSATFRSDAAALEVREQTVTPDGIRATLTVPPGAQSVRVVSQVGNIIGAFRLKLHDASLPPVLEAAVGLRRGGRIAEAKAVLEAGLAQLSGIDRARALGLLARLELGLGHYERARLAFERALELDRLHGAVSLEMEDACALTFLMITRLYMFEEAKSLLDATRQTANRTADGRARFPYFEGLLHFESGDLRKALVAFRASRDAAQRLGLSVHEWTARDRIAAVLQALGRTREAIAELEALRKQADPAISDCERADVLINLGWYLVEDPSAHEADLLRATELLTEARGLFPQKCADPFRHAVSLTNLAYAAVRRGAMAEAKQHLDAARATDETEEGLRLWWLDLQGRLDLATGAPLAAKQVFERASALAETLLLPDLRFRALIGLAESLEQRRDTKAALHAYGQAEAVLDHHALGVPLGEGRAAFLSAHDVSAKGLIELQLQNADPRAAFQTARHARTRLLRALEESARVGHLDAAKRARWLSIVSRYGRARAELLDLSRAARDLPLDQMEQAEASGRARQHALTAQLEQELAALASPTTNETPATTSGSELTLLFRPMRAGWVGFASQSGTVQAHVFTEPPAPLELRGDTAAWLAPFESFIGRASRVQVMSEGELSALDFHALTFRSQALLAHATVSYALDLPPLPVSSIASESALVISDPSLDLPLAREEGNRVSSLLRSQSVQVDLLEGHAATNRSVAARMPVVDHIHFAGHAFYAGTDGFESELRLADGEGMSMADVLASSITAKTVILSGCKAGQVRGETDTGLGIASAFAIAGARTVIAPTRSIDDADTARLMQLLYDNAPPLTEADWSERLRHAQLTLHDERPAADWSAFRALTR